MVLTICGKLYIMYVFVDGIKNMIGGLYDKNGYGVDDPLRAKEYLIYRELSIKPFLKNKEYIFTFKRISEERAKEIRGH